LPQGINVGASQTWPGLLEESHREVDRLLLLGAELVVPGLEDLEHLHRPHADDIACEPYNVNTISRGDPFRLQVPAVRASGGSLVTINPRMPGRRGPRDAAHAAHDRGLGILASTKAKREHAAAGHRIAHRRTVSGRACAHRGGAQRWGFVMIPPRRAWVPLDRGE